MKTKEELDKILSDIYSDITRQGYCDGDIVSYYTFSETCTNLGYTPDDEYIEGLLEEYNIVIA